MRYKQQLCEINWTFDASNCGHKPTYVATFDSAAFPVEVPAKFFWTCAQPDSLKRLWANNQSWFRVFTFCASSPFLMWAAALRSLHSSKKHAKCSLLSSLFYFFPTFSSIFLLSFFFTFNNSHLCKDKFLFTWKIEPVAVDVIGVILYPYNMPPYTHRMFRYSQHNVKEGDCLHAAPLQLLSEMLKAATWWTAQQSGSKGSKALSGMYRRESKKIDFDAEAERVRCSGSMLNYLQTGIVTDDEQISDTCLRVHHPCVVWVTEEVWYVQTGK